MNSKLNQPKGLYVLSFTEIFERFSFYTLSFLLVIYTSTSISNGGLGWANEKSLQLVGLYTMAAYTLPLFGAYIADRKIGRSNAVTLGASLIIFGHFLMLFSYLEELLYIALALIALGTSFFKPCIPSLLGDLYHPNDTRRESGFSWYYFGINLGGMIAGITSGLLFQKFGFQIALASAGLGMIVGIFVFFSGRQYLNFETQKKIIFTNISKPTKMTKNQINALYCLIIAFGFFAIWATVYNLALSGTLTLYIEKYTNKEIFGYNIPTTFFMSLDSLTILFFTPILTFILSRLALKNKYPHFFTQMNVAILISAIALLYFTYLSHYNFSLLSEIKPYYYYQIMIFIIILAISEAIISPVMMSAISSNAPNNYKSLFQSIYLAIYGFTSLLASKIGTMSLHSPFKTFLIFSIIIFTGGIIYLLIKGVMIKITEKAMNEQLKS